MDLSADLADRPAYDILAELQTVPFPITPLPSPRDGWTRDETSGAELLEVARIVPDPEQPRKDLDAGELQRLAASVKRHGILQPVRVQWLVETGQWMLVAGERRVEAARAAGLARIPAVRTDAALTPAQALQEQIAENLLREDLNPIEEASALRRLIVLAGWTQQKLCEQCHLAPSAVSKALKLLELEEPVQAHVAAGRIVRATAEALALLSGAEQIELAAKVIARSLTTSQTVQEIAKIRGHAGEFQFEIPPADGQDRPRLRLKVPREVIRIERGRVIVQAAGDVDDSLREALRVRRRQRQQEPPAPSAQAA